MCLQLAFGWLTAPWPKSEMLFRRLLCYMVIFFKINDEHSGSEKRDQQENLKSAHCALAAAASDTTATPGLFPSQQGFNVFSLRCFVCRPMTLQKRMWHSREYSTFRECPGLARVSSLSM